MMWVKQTIGMFSFKKRLLPWDTYESHITDDVKKELKKANTAQAFIPGGCTKYIQAPDVSWNKPFKQIVSDYYDEWLANGVHEYTEAGNLKTVPRTIVQWVVDGWKVLPADLIKKSFRCCALTLPTTGEADDEIVRMAGRF